MEATIVAQRGRQRMAELKMGWVVLGRKAGVNHGTAWTVINKWKRTPKNETRLEAIARALEVSVAWLLGNEQ